MTIQERIARIECLLVVFYELLLEDMAQRVKGQKPQPDALKIAAVRQALGEIADEAEERVDAEKIIQ